MNRDTLSTTRKQPKRAENAYVFVTVSCVLRVQCAGSASLIFQLIRYAICRSFIIMILIKFQSGGGVACGDFSHSYPESFFMISSPRCRSRRLRYFHKELKMGRSNLSVFLCQERWRGRAPNSCPFSLSQSLNGVKE